MLYNQNSKIEDARTTSPFQQEEKPGNGRSQEPQKTEIDGDATNNTPSNTREKKLGSVFSNKTHFNITLQPQKTFLTTLNFKERVDDEAFSRLLNAPSNVLRVIDEKWREEFNIQDYTNEKEQLLKIHDKSKNIKYVMNSSGWGRVMPSRSISIGLIRRKLRHTLCDGVYVDVDIENAHPVILLQAMKNNGIQCPHLEKYVNERNEILKETIQHYGLSDEEDKTGRDKAKNLFIRLMYLGSLNTWAKDNKCDNKPNYQFALEFQEEMNKIAEVIMEANPELVKYYKKKAYNAKQRGNHTAKLESSVMSIWCQEIERRCLEEMVAVVPERLREYLVLCYDGMMIPEEIFEDIMPYTMMKRIEKNLGLKLKITKKDMSDKYDVSQYEPANMWYEAVKNEAEKKDGLCWVRDIKTIFYKSSKGEWKQMKPTELDFEYRNKLSSFAKDWSYDRNRKEYNTVGFAIDSTSLPETTLNIAPPMAFEKFDKNNPPNAPFNLIQKHIHLLTGGNLAYMEDFLAWRVRRPDDLIPVSFLIRTHKEGCGKTWIWRQIADNWFNRSVLLQSNSENSMGFKEFNSQMMGKMFLNWEEVEGKKGFNLEDALKDLITADTLYINAKHEKPITVQNNATVIINSNNIITLKITAVNRRWVVFEASKDLPANIEDKEYFDRLATQTENPKCWEAYYHHLRYKHQMNHDITKPSHFQNFIPKTEFSKEIKRVSISDSYLFFMDRFKNDLEANELDIEYEYTGKDLQDEFKDWCRENDRPIRNRNGFYACFKDIDSLRKDHKITGNVYTIHIQEFLDEYSKKYY